MNSNDFQPHLPLQWSWKWVLERPGRFSVSTKVTLSRPTVSSSMMESSWPQLSIGVRPQARRHVRYGARPWSRPRCTFSDTRSKPNGRPLLANRCCVTCVFFSRHKFVIGPTFRLALKIPHQIRRWTLNSILMSSVNEENAFKFLPHSRPQTSSPFYLKNHSRNIVGCWRF